MIEVKILRNETNINEMIMVKLIYNKYKIDHDLNLLNLPWMGTFGRTPYRWWEPLPNLRDQETGISPEFSNSEPPSIDIPCQQVSSADP